MSLKYENINTRISPLEFELIVKEYLSNLDQKLGSLKVKHDQNLESDDGTYQIDVVAEFEFLGANFKVLIECKRHKNPIKREVVQILYSKIQSLGASKGMIFATTKFQKGALEYAKKHGIALIRVIDEKYNYINKSLDFHEDLSLESSGKFVLEYRTEKAISYIQEGYMEPLNEYLFR